MRRTQPTGMTFIEILVVVAIIGLLATIVAIGIGAYRAESQQSKAENDLKNAQKAVTLLESATDQWPNHETPGTLCADDPGCDTDMNEIWDLRDPGAGLLETDGSFDNWDGPYVINIAEDPWGNPHFYDSDYDLDTGAGDEPAVVVGSFGPDAKDATQTQLDNDHYNQYGAAAEDNIVMILTK